MRTALHIDVYFDLICPWCLIGKRNLEKALQQFQSAAPEIDVDVAWHSVQLLPDAPPEGWDFEAFYLKRLGSFGRIRQRQAQVNAEATKAGFQIDFSQIARMPNTLQAHQLLEFASTCLPAKPFADLLEHLFEAHFCLGQDLGDRTSLCEIAASHGLSHSAMEKWFTDGFGKLRTLSGPGVPLFVFNQHAALSGAQSPELLLSVMHEVCAGPTNGIKKCNSTEATL